MAGRYSHESDVKSESPDNEVPQPRQRRAARGGASRPSNGASRDEFQPGAIVRVRLENFVTYEKAEFSLGPNLNMVIGPNGTGKSSLVCAICLGLGYASNVLGRASAFGDFVKHGKDEAQIEVELQRRPQDRENHVVGLCIRREDNSRKFTLNGSRSSVKEVQNLMRALRIQIDNLCQFLPQDKVAEFAGLTPVELLEKTLHAAAAPEMIEWQRELKENFVAQKEAHEIAEKSKAELRKLETRQQVLQADVEKLQERKLIQETIERLEAMHLVLRYDEARKTHGVAKEKLKKAQVNLKRLQESSAPALQAVNKKQEYEAKVQAFVSDRRAALRASEVAANEARALIDGADSQHQALVAKLEAERTNFEFKRKELAKIRRKLTELEAKRKQPPRDFDAADWNRRIRESEHLERDKAAEVADLDEQHLNLRSQGREKKDQLHKLMKDMEEFDSQEGQLLNQLKRFSPDVASGWEWLKEHQDEFEQNVFGPPVLSCSVKDLRYSDLIQSTLGLGDLLCFTAQTKNDHKKLSAKFYTDLKLSVTIRTCLRSLDSFQPPIPREQLTNLGFDGYVLDYLDGPRPVLAMLCAEKRIHASPLSLNDLTDDQHDRLKSGERISQYACGKQTFKIIRRREYGQHVTVRISLIQRGRWWTDQPADVSEKGDLQRKQIELQRELDEVKDLFKQKREELEAANLEKNALRENTDTLRREKNELQLEFSKYQSLPDKIESETRSLRQKIEEVRSAKHRISDIGKEMGQVILDKAKAVLSHQRKIGGIRSAYHELLEAELLLVEAKSDVAHLKDRNSEIVQRLEEEKKSLNVLKVELEEKKRDAQRLFTEVKELSDEHRQDSIAEARDRTAEVISQEISAERAKLEVIQANNPQALEEYENWARRIEKEKADHDVQETRLADLTEKITTLRSQWEPRLDELVGQINDAFSYNFEQISCAGEVGVHKDEEFDKWAIEIKVKFRQGETLQRLDQHRQSGGERAVSTIFYLMSLQSMAQAPFRVVDEINQGMDPRNERMVHERMVEIACREHTSQYFLITPKLLSGLRYDERMRVHTIVSGEHVDENGTEKMDFAKFARIQRGVMAR